MKRKKKRERKEMLETKKRREKEKDDERIDEKRDGREIVKQKKTSIAGVHQMRLLHHCTIVYNVI